jgi:hypothetical protein
MFPMPEQWRSHFEGEAMPILDAKAILRDIRATLKSKRFIAGQLAKRGAPALSSCERKRRQKVAILKAQFKKL